MKTLDLANLHTIREQLLDHPLYQEINTPERVRIFMKYHVFAVWDFMSLLKKLQQSLTCVTYPWIPRSNANYARFINEIVLGEETDEDGEGGYISHFELYLKAMKEVGADTKPIENYVQKISSGEDPFQSLEVEEIPESAANFVKVTLQTAMKGKIHETASSFFFGREEVIPDMFSLLVREIEEKNLSAKNLKYYLHRHIELDGDEHGPLAEKLLVSLCANEPQKIEEAHVMAERSLKARMQLWDGVLQEIKELGI